MIKAPKRYFSYTSTDAAIFKYYTKLVLIAYFLAVWKNSGIEITFFWEGMLRILEIRYLILDAMVPLQLLASSHCYLKCYENVIGYYKK